MEAKDIEYEELIIYRSYMSDIARSKFQEKPPRYYDVINPDTRTIEDVKKQSDEVISFFASKMNMRKKGDE